MMNGIENDKKRRMQPERILEMFAEVVKQHASQSYDFPISDVSDKMFFYPLVLSCPFVDLCVKLCYRAFMVKFNKRQECDFSDHNLRCT